MRRVTLYITRAWLIILTATGILAPWLSTDKPWVVNYNGNWLLPAFNNSHARKILPEENLPSAWKLINFEYAVWPPCTYRPGSIDWYNISVSPLGAQQFINLQSEVISMPIIFRHWLGTNHKGEDVLAAVIIGCQRSLAVGFFSMLLAGFIGVFLGISAGFYQNHVLHISRGALAGFLFGIIPSVFYGFVRRMHLIADASEKRFYTMGSTSVSLIIFIILLVGFMLIGKKIGEKTPRLNKRVAIPVDAIITRITEWINSIPKLFLVLILAGIFNKTASGLVLIVGTVMWTGVARIVRAETLSLRQTAWAESSISLGLSEFRILKTQLFPHILPSFIVLFILGIANGIMAESALSFLAAGVPNNWISWGTLLGDGKRFLDNWWLIASPGVLLFSTLLCLSVLAEQYRRK